MSIRLLENEKGVILEEVHSTNDWIKQPQNPPGSWVLANFQTQGRGRKGKSWTIFGEEHIIFSGKILIQSENLPIQLISLFAGSSLLKAIFQWIPEREKDLRIKWPNDLYRGSKKVAGILVESEFRNQEFEIVIGLGLNLYGREIPDEWKGRAGYVCDSPLLEGSRERILYSFIEYFNQSLITLMDNSGILRELEWIQNNSTLVGKIVKFNDEGFINHGEVLGFDNRGFLVLLDSTGMKKTLSDTDENFEVI